MVFLNLTNDNERGTLTNVGTKNISKLNDQLGPTRKFQVNQAIESRGGLRFNYAYGVQGAIDTFVEGYSIPSSHSKSPAVRCMRERRTGRKVLTVLFLRKWTRSLMWV